MIKRNIKNSRDCLKCILEYIDPFFVIKYQQVSKFFYKKVIPYTLTYRQDKISRFNHKKNKIHTYVNISHDTQFSLSATFYDDQ